MIDGILEWLLRNADPDEAEALAGDLRQGFVERGSGWSAALWFCLEVSRTPQVYYRNPGNSRRNLMTGILFSELSQSVKSLVRAPAFAVVSILTIGLGVGLNAVVFSVVDSILLAPLPYPAPDQLFSVNETNGNARGTAAATYVALRERSSTLSDVAAAGGLGTMAMDQPGDLPVAVSTQIVSAGYFNVLGALPVAGRLFAPGDDGDDSENTVVLSHRLWADRFSSDGDVVGSDLILNGQTFTVVGVVSEDFVPLDLGVDLWVSAKLTSASLNSPTMSFRLIARSPENGVDAILSDVSRIQDQLKTEMANWRNDPAWAMHVAPLKETVVRDASSTLLLTQASAGMLLLITLTNIAGLVTARVASRESEMAVRTAMGASAFRNGLSVTTEGALVAIAGTGLGVAIAAVMLDPLVASIPGGVPRSTEIGIGGAPMLAALLALLATVFIGLIPGMIVGRRSPQQTLRAVSGRSTLGSNRLLVRRSIVAVQAAIVVVLLVCGGLLVRSFSAMATAETGVSLSDRYYARLSLPNTRYPDQTTVDNFTTELAGRLQADPQIRSVGFSTTRPLSRSLWNFLYIQGITDADGELPVTGFEAVTPEFFEASGVQVLRGRQFERLDHDTPANVVIVNETLVREQFGDTDPLGRMLGFGREGPFYRVVGVVADVQVGLQPVGPQVYLPNLRIGLPWHTGWRWLLIHAPDTEAAQILSSVKEAITTIDGSLPLPAVQPFSNLRSWYMDQPRFNSLLVSVFGLMALALSAIGVYGLVRQSINGRRREIGIRIAIGQPSDRLVGLLVRSEIMPLAIGAACGLAAAYLSRGLMTDLVWGIAPGDPATLIAAPVILLGTGVAALLSPVRKAMRIDPTIILKAD